MKVNVFTYRTKGRLIIMLLGGLLACQDMAEQSNNQPGQLFVQMLPAHTGIDFSNDVSYDEAFNVYTYRNFYNGGGVALGDINNDGLVDLYFCGNMVDNRLYLNKGNFRFEDITRQAGVACAGVWSSGVSFADVNGDGWLDLYVCKSGNPEGENRHNELFINQGDLTFIEQAEDYGIADKGLSTHAAFFDYDRDGDLDCYLLNNSFRSVGGYDLRPDQRNIRDPLGGNKLYRKDGDRYVDVSEAAGIYGSAIGFGLGVTIGDVNRDGWPDIYVSNDFFERDYLYLNRQNGSFEESLETYMREISLGSMGADMADLNNDGYPEIFVTDMLPEDDARLKTKTTFEDWNKYQRNVKTGYHHQFTRNVLQLNLGPVPHAEAPMAFSEIGRMAGVFATDWSWGALIMDLDNNGFKDIFVANGIYKDLNDQDYINFFANPETIRRIKQRDNAVIKRLVDSIPSQKIPNYAFANQGNLQFVNQAEAWGLASPSHSNGAAYGDLDLDGDLDLVINNCNMPAFVYKNQVRQLHPERHFLSLSLQGEGGNTFALGAQVEIRHQGHRIFQEHMPIRGFMSSMDYRLHLGLGAWEQVDTLWVHWPDGRQTLLTDVKADQQLSLRQAEASLMPQASSPSAEPLPMLAPLKDPAGLDFTHEENAFLDFDRDRLLFHMLSNEGPKMAVADVDGNGLEDLYIGGAKNAPGALFLQHSQGFRRSQTEVFEADRASEDTDAIFFDANGDGAPDLYVASGGNEFSNSSPALRDRLYFNDGKGGFQKSAQILPAGRFESSSCVRAGDFDGDGDQDLFVGLRLRPFLYGVPVQGYLLENDGQGTFLDVTAAQAPGLQELGLLTDAQWLDVEGDGDLDLAIVGEWMPLSLFIQEPEGFVNRTKSAGLLGTTGLWNCLAVADLDGDGDPDLIGGNHGLNSRFKAWADRPLSLYVNDFDRNGKAEQIICMYNGEGSYPLCLRQDLVKQISELKRKYLKFSNYREQTINDLFTPEQLAGMIHREVRHLASTCFWNEGNGRFSIEILPQQAQLAPVYSILVAKLGNSQRPDLVLGGNLYRAKPETGIYDASYGLVLSPGEGRSWVSLPARKSGLFVKGEIRDFKLIRTPSETWLLVARNNLSLEGFTLLQPSI